MAEKTKIEWCDATFNPWKGCTKWGPDCANCYAALFSLRTGGPEYAKGVPRQRCIGFESSALRLASKAARLGKRLKVFPSLCDVFDAEVPPEWRADFWRVVDATRDRLDWLILTKRTENIAGMLPEGWGDGWVGVWLGMSAGDQKTFDRRVGDFLRVKAQVLFLSYEPAFGPLDVRNAVIGSGCGWCYGRGHNPVSDAIPCRSCGPGIDWIIAGSESGPRRRKADLDWFRSVRDQCANAGVAFFLKQAFVGGQKVSLPDLDGRQHAEFPAPMVSP